MDPNNANESVGLPDPVGLPESEGLSSLQSGINLAPLENLVVTVNENLKDWKWYKVLRLKLVSDDRTGLASNWKLVYKSCIKKKGPCCRVSIT